MVVQQMVSKNRKNPPGDELRQYLLVTSRFPW